MGLWGKKEKEKKNNKVGHVYGFISRVLLLFLAVLTSQQLTCIYLYIY